MCATETYLKMSNKHTFFVLAIILKQFHQKTWIGKQKKIHCLKQIYIFILHDPTVNLISGKFNKRCLCLCLSLKFGDWLLINDLYIAS